MTLGYDNPPVVARLAAELGCPGVPVEVADLCTLKDRRIAALDRAGLPVPRFSVATTADAALAALDRIGLPAVVKPSDRTGSLGVAKLDDRGTAREPVERALALSPTGRVVVEEYLTGTEHTVAGFAVEGRLRVTGFADREYGEKERFFPHFFEGGDTPALRLGRGTARRGGARGPAGRRRARAAHRRRQHRHPAHPPTGGCTCWRSPAG